MGYNWYSNKKASNGRMKSTPVVLRRRKRRSEKPPPIGWDAALGIVLMRSQVRKPAVDGPNGAPLSVHSLAAIETEGKRGGNIPAYRLPALPLTLAAAGGGS